MELLKEWLSPQEVQARYGFSVSSLAKWRMRNKNLKFSKMGKYIKYNAEDIEAYIKSNMVEVA
jgi:hypothetical protein